MKRVFQVLFFVSMLSLIVVGGVSATEEVVELTFWNGFTGPDRVQVTELVNRFNNQNPDVNIKMEIMPWDSLFQKLLPSFSVGQGPDIAAFGTEYIPRFAKADVIVPIDDFYEEYLDPSVVIPSFYESNKWEGNAYGSPMSFFALLMYYNKDMFKDAGLAPNKPPQTWDELKDYAVKLTKDTNDDGQIDQYGFGVSGKVGLPLWPIFIWNNGGDIINNGEVKINSQQAVDAVKSMSDLIINEKISPVGISGPETDKLFQTGKAAMHITGPWMIGGFENAGLNFGVAQMPGEKITYGSGTAMVLNKASVDKKDAAYRFFKFWNSIESQLYWSLNVGFPPNRTDISEEKLAENPYVLTSSKAAQNTKPYLPKIEEYTTVNEEIIGGAIEKILYEEATVEEALNTAAEEIEEIMD